MRYAAIDVGTNSCRLLIADIKAGHLNSIHKEIETTRIGEGVDKLGIINADAINRTINCLKNFNKKMQDNRVIHYRAIATSAVREALNKEEFIRLARDISCIEIDVVDGEEEARLSCLGVKMGLDLPHPPLVVDLGGGSTEFICEDEDFILSIPLGAVRATEAQMYAVDIIKLLAPIKKARDKFSQHPVVFTGGTASTMVAIKSGMEIYDEKLVHGQVLSRLDIGDLYNFLESMPLNLRKRLPGLQPERADIIPKGALIMLMIIDVLGKDKVIVSENDLLEGIIWSIK